MGLEGITRSKSLVYIVLADLHQRLAWYPQDMERELGGGV
jgi:hypothetical protein